MTDNNFSLSSQFDQQGNVLVGDASCWNKCLHLKIMRTVIDYEFLLKDSEVHVLSISPNKEFINALCFKTQISIIIPQWALRLVKEDWNFPNPYLKFLSPSQSSINFSIQPPALTPLSPSSTETTDVSQKNDNPSTASEDEHVIRKIKKVRKRTTVWDKKYDVERKKKGTRGHGVNLLWDQKSKCTTPYPDSIDRYLDCLLNYKPSSFSSEVVGVATFTPTAIQTAKQSIDAFATKSWRVWLPNDIWAKFSLLKAICTPYGTTSVEFVQMLILLKELYSDNLIEIVGFLDFQETSAEVSTSLMSLNNKNPTEGQGVLSDAAKSTSLTVKEKEKEKSDSSHSNNDDSALSFINNSEGDNFDFDLSIMNSDNKELFGGNDLLLNPESCTANEQSNNATNIPAARFSNFSTTGNSGISFPSEISQQQLTTTMLPSSNIYSNSPASLLNFAPELSSTDLDMRLTGNFNTQYQQSSSPASSSQYLYSPSVTSSTFNATSPLDSANNLFQNLKSPNNNIVNNENVEIIMNGVSVVIPASQLSEALAYIQHRNNVNQLGVSNGLVSNIQEFLLNVPYTAGLVHPSDPDQNRNNNNQSIFKVEKGIADAAADALAEIKTEPEAEDQESLLFLADMKKENDTLITRTKLTSALEKKVAPNFQTDDNSTGSTAKVADSEIYSYVKASEFQSGSIVHLVDIQKRIKEKTKDPAFKLTKNLNKTGNVIDKPKKRMNFENIIKESKSASLLFDKDNVNKRKEELNGIFAFSKTKVNQEDDTKENLVAVKIEKEQLTEVLKLIGHSVNGKINLKDPENTPSNQRQEFWVQTEKIPFQHFVDAKQNAETFGYLEQPMKMNSSTAKTEKKLEYVGTSSSKALSDVANFEQPNIPKDNQKEDFERWWDSGQDVKTLIELFDTSSNNSREKPLSMLITCYLKKANAFGAELLAESLSILMKRNYCSSKEVGDIILSKTNFDNDVLENEEFSENLSSLLKVLVLKSVVSIKEIIERGIDFGKEDDDEEDYEKEEANELISKLDEEFENKEKFNQSLAHKFQKIEINSTVEPEKEKKLNNTNEVLEMMGSVVEGKTKDDRLEDEKINKNSTKKKDFFIQIKWGQRTFEVVTLKEIKSNENLIARSELNGSLVDVFNLNASKNSKTWTINYKNTKEDQMSNFNDTVNLTKIKSSILKRLEIKKITKEKALNLIFILIIFILILIIIIITLCIYYLKNKRKLKYVRLENSPLNSSEGDSQKKQKNFDFEGLTEGKVFKVISDHKPNLNDELNCNKGDSVLITKVFDDGWIRGTNLTLSGRSGMLPASFLTRD
ncbi:hypothetical protein HDU92_001530 [Lobulomyces angularis]|nr:hypothetical protein HDU92_001530 [Lobulomyces angularis]